MSLKKHWKQVKEVIEAGQMSTIYCSIASVNPDGTPNVTPVGTVFLRDDMTGYYFEHYSKALSDNLDKNPNICVMAVNAGKWFWLKSLFRGQFTAPPGVRLYGKAGPIRAATPEEIQLIERRVKPTLWLKGARMLWTGFSHVRDIEFTSFRPITYPIMMDGVWPTDVNR